MDPGGMHGLLSHEAIRLAGLALAIVTGGVGVVIVSALHKSRANLIQFGFIMAITLDIATLPTFLNRVDAHDPSIWARLQGMFEATGIVLTGAWVLALLASSTEFGARARVVRAAGWLTVAFGGTFAVICYVWPAERFNDYLLSLGEPGALSRPGFWLFAASFLVVAVPILLSWAILTFGRIDPAEARRMRSFVVASTFVITATAVPPVVAGLCVAAWISLGLYGEFQYASAHAQRSVFLSRFLSSQVAELVAVRGLAETMQPHHAELSVVCADLRGFTAYSEGVPSHVVVDLLAEYYEAIEGVVTRHGGTITNLAGDGVMILVGAPVPEPDHATIGIRLAREVQIEVRPVLERWQTRVHALGIGVGVASGRVTAGAISAGARMEYTAIGTPVNLAARLCDMAASNEVLVDAEAARLGDASDLRVRGDVAIKGLSGRQQIYVYATGQSPNRHHPDQDGDS